MSPASRTVLLLVLLGGVACGESARPEAKPAPLEPAAAPATSAPTPADTEPTPEQLPLEDDFNAQAEQEITADNYRAALDAIEHEITADAARK